MQPEIRGFIFLRKDSLNRFQLSSPNPEMLKTKSRGYKMHISVHDADDVSSNLMHAWDIFVIILLRYEIYQVKIVVPSFRDALRRDEDQRGKEITICCFKELRPPEEWQEFCREVTRGFVEQHIVAGVLPPDDASIRGSSYFSYVNDSSADLPNPFSSIDLTSIEGQPPRISIERAVMREEAVADHTP